jgi:microcystin-dependent protein
MEGMIGEVRLFAGNFAPKNWSFCNGATIAIASNTALFSILGTTYGGNGTTTFQLPNLQSRVCVGVGSGPGLSNYSLGQVGGSETVTLTTQEMPAHTHAANGSYAPFVQGGSGDESNPTAGYVAITPGSDIFAGNSNITMGPINVSATLTPNGGNQPHENQQPYLGMNYVLCMYGIYPSRG